MAGIKRFKPKNMDEYVELKPGIYARKDRLKNVVRADRKSRYTKEMERKKREEEASA